MPKRFYPIFILTLLGSFLIFSSWSAYRAATHGSEVTDREYYSKGLKYNTTMIEQRAASVLGWKLSSKLNKQQLQISLTDADGSPVVGAQGKLVFFQQAQVSNNSLLLNESSPGTYLAELPSRLRGSIAVRVDFERQGARINRQLLLNI